MTTKAPETISVDPWDFFLEDDLATEHVERFREQEWPQMLKELKHDYSYSIGEGQEPHWVTPGTAVLYHEVINISYGKEENTGWHPTNPLPIGNAVQLLNYLKKGFRLRANVDALVDVELLETADSTEGDSYEDTSYEVPTAKGKNRKFINLRLGMRSISRLAADRSFGSFDDDYQFETSPNEQAEAVTKENEEN